MASAGVGYRGVTPKYKEPGAYRPASYDLGKIRGYQQEALAPGVSQLRRALRGVQAGRYGSPTERGVAIREAVRGYGEALAPLQVGASREAMQRYLPEYQQAIVAEQQRISAEREKNILEYQQELDEYNRKRQEEDNRRLLEQQTAVQGAIPQAIPMKKQTKGWGMDAPQTIVRVGGRTYTMPGNYSVEGLSEASRRALPPGYGATPSRQEPQSPENIQSFNPNWWA